MTKGKFRHRKSIVLLLWSSHLRSAERFRVKLHPLSVRLEGRGPIGDNGAVRGPSVSAARQNVCSLGEQTSESPPPERQTLDPFRTCGADGLICDDLLSSCRGRLRGSTPRQTAIIKKGVTATERSAAGRRP